MRRPNPVRVGVTCAALTLIAFYVVAWAGASRVQTRANDFSDFYAAAQLVRHGQAGQLYDQAIEQREHNLVLDLGPQGPVPFNTPPLTAVMTVPLTVLGIDAAYRVFSLLQLALVVAAVAVVARSAPWSEGSGGPAVVVGSLAVAGVATLHLFLNGQLDGVAALAVALAYRGWRRSHSFQAGLCLGLGFALVKPHLALGLVLFMLGRRDWRALAGAGAAAALLIALSLLVAGPAAMVAFIHNTTGVAGLAPAESISLYGFFGSWLGHAATAALVATAAVSLAGGAMCLLCGHLSRDLSRLEAGLAGAMILSLLLGVHMNLYDLVSLAPAFVFLAARLVTDRPGRVWPRWQELALVGGWLAVNVLADIDDPDSGFAPSRHVIPAVLFLIATALALWRPGALNPSLRTIARWPTPRPFPPWLRSPDS